MTTESSPTEGAEARSGRPVHADQPLQAAILECALDPIIVIDGAGRIVEFNPAAERTFGYERHAVLGLEMASLIVPARLRDAHRAGLRRVVETGVATLFGRRIEMIATRADGTEFPVELALARAAGDAPVLFTGYLRDISQPKHAEQSLLDRAKLASLGADVGTALTRTDTLSDMLKACAEAVVARLDAAFARIWTLNAAEQMLELRASAGLYTHRDGPHGRVPVGQFKIGLIAAERRAHLTNHVIGDPRVGDQAWAKREGMVAFAGYPLMIGDEIVGVLAMFSRRALSETDFEGLATVAQGIALGIARQRGVDTIRERAEQLARMAGALERSNRELDQFAYVASHDLKTPLRGIANLSQWIEEDLGPLATDATRQQLDLLRGRVHRMEALIDGILEYSRAGRLRTAVETVDVRQLVQDIVDLLPVPASIHIEIDPDLPTLVTHRIPLQQVLQNLLSNAIKHSRGAPGPIRVGAVRSGAEWTFQVADRGPGIAPEFHQRIWGIFQTLEARDTVEGTGIGLALVKKVVEGRGGRVWLDSAAGRGATFGFTWPENPSGEPRRDDARADA